MYYRLHEAKPSDTIKLSLQMSPSRNADRGEPRHSHFMSKGLRTVRSENKSLKSTGIHTTFGSRPKHFSPNRLAQSNGLSAAKFERLHQEITAAGERQAKYGADIFGKQKEVRPENVLAQKMTSAHKRKLVEFYSGRFDDAGPSGYVDGKNGERRLYKERQDIADMLGG
jgi:hypothetical protein